MLLLLLIVGYCRTRWYLVPHCRTSWQLVLQARGQVTNLPYKL